MINIYDVSAFVYAGMGTTYGRKATYKGIPTGGIYNMLRAICSAVKQKDVVVLAFDSWTNAKTIIPEYKGGRSKNPDVRFQVDLIYDYLKNAIPNCLKFEGYEADWIAASVFEEIVQNTQLSVAGYTVDLDWAHNIINDRTVLYPASKNAYYISKENFSNVVSTKETFIPFNAISMYKVLFGDTSDNIGKINIPLKYSLSDLLQIFNQYCSNNNLDNRLKESAISFVEFLGSMLSDTCKQELLKRIEVIYPRPMSNRPPLVIEYIEPQSLQKLISVSGCKSLAKNIGIDFLENMGELQEIARERYLAEKGQVSSTRLFTKSVDNTSNLVIKDRGGFVQ